VVSVPSVAIVEAATAPLVVAAPPLVATVRLSLLAKTTAASATMTAVIAIGLGALTAIAR
tara:strand:- start:563 stop:742 length:180 start_codon:yes stop_codon:yes gene_type:complete